MCKAISWSFFTVDLKIVVGILRAKEDSHFAEVKCSFLLNRKQASSSRVYLIV